MRLCRFALLLILAFLAVMCVLPWTALANSSWAIKDKGRHTRGQVMSTGKNTCNVIRKSTGKVVGDMFFTDGGEGWMIRWYFSNGVDYTGAMVTPPKTAASRYYLSRAGDLKKVGRAVRGSSRWLLYRMVKGKWQKIGSAPKTCPGEFAMGAARVLLWK